VWQIALVAVVFGGCAHPPACDPAEYGRQCEGEGKYSQCEDPNTTCTNACWGDRLGWETKSCAVWQPHCIDVETTASPEIVCLGEIIGTCETRGFVRCEDDDTIVECLADASGQLVLSRGSCGDFYVCVGIGKTQYPGCVFHTNV
jgi:hypothetical protein